MGSAACTLGQMDRYYWDYVMIESSETLAPVCYKCKYFYATNSTITFSLTQCVS